MTWSHPSPRAHRAAPGSAANAPSALRVVSIRGRGGRHGLIGRLPALVAALAMGLLCSAVAAAQPAPTPTATPRLQAITLSPATAKRAVGQTQNFTATGLFTDGSTKNMTQLVEYDSSDTSVVVTPNIQGNKGQVQAVGPGIATIIAIHPDTGITSSLSGGDAQMEVVVAPTPTPTRTGPTPTATRSPTPTATATPRLQSLTLSPASAKRGVGQTQNFSTTGTFTDGSTKNMTQLVTYASSDTTIVVCPNEAGNRGRVQAVGPGIATISATDPATGVRSSTTGGDAQMEVVVAPTPTPTRTGPTPTATRSPTPTATATPQLQSLTLSPASAKRAVGQTQNFSTTGTFTDGSTKNMTQLVTYASSDTTVVVAPNETGNRGRVQAVGPGIAIISATDPATGVRSSTTGGDAQMEVVVAPTPTPTRTGPTPTATRSPTPTATATPRLQSLALSPATAKRLVGDTKNFTATGTFTDGSTKNMTQLVTYASSDPQVAEAPNIAGNRGLIRAVGVGIATISATDPATGVSSATSNGNAQLEVVAAPTPTPTRTGPTPTATLSPSPTPTTTPRLQTLTLSPTAAKRAVGDTKNFTATGTFTDGSTKNMTQLVTYASSDPQVAEAPNIAGNRGLIRAVGVGIATISATDPATGVGSATSNGNAQLEVVAGQPRPTATGPTAIATPAPEVDHLQDPATARAADACQRQLAKAAGRFVAKKLSILHGCVDRLVNCVQTRPGDGTCIDKAGTKCSDALARLGAEASKLAGTVIDDCGALAMANVLADAGLGFETTRSTCEATYKSAIDDTAGLGQCLVAQHGCLAESLLVVQQPRAGELLARVAASLPPDTCLEDFGGDGTAAAASADVGKLLARCQRAIGSAATRLATRRLSSLERCAGALFSCAQPKAGDNACLARAHARCARTLTTLEGDSAALGATLTRKCGGLDFALLRSAAGANLDALGGECVKRGVASLDRLSDYGLCMLRQHVCTVDALLRFEIPRLDEVMGLVGMHLDPPFCGP